MDMNHFFFQGKYDAKSASTNWEVNKDNDGKCYICAIA